MYNKILIILSLSLMACSSLNANNNPDDYILSSYNYNPEDFDNNPIVNRLSKEEIEEGTTPAAVAYNFVNVLLNNDEKAIMSLLTDEWREHLQNIINVNFDGNFKDFLNDYFKGRRLNIMPWKDLVNQGYEITVGLIDDESTFNEDGSWYGNPYQKVIEGQIYLPGESEPRPTKITNKVYIICCPSAQVGNTHFQDIDLYDNNYMRVFVEWCGPENGWKAAWFK